MENDMVVPSPEQAAKMMLEAAMAGPLGMRPTHVLKHFTLRKLAIDRGVHIDDFPAALEYAVQQGWLEQLDGGFFRLTEAGFAAASISSAMTQPPSSGRGEATASGAMTASSEGQSGGVTANEVHFHGATTIHGPAFAPSPTPTTKPPKSPWWKSWWAIISGAAVILAGVVPTLDYFQVKPPLHTAVEPVQAPHLTAPAPASKAAETSQSSTHSDSATGLAQQSGAKPTTPLLRKWSPDGKPPKDREPSVVNNVGTVYNNSGIIAPGATGSITQEVRGYVPPPPRVMTDEQLTAMIEKLQTAPPQSVARLNFAASNDNTEVHAFFAQVETAFKTADHWTVSSQQIGKSMGTADGGTLTAEGIGCTVTGTHGSVAIDAMAAAGFPCTRKAADWGVANPPPGDVVISIGSRVVPQE